MYYYGIIYKIAGNHIWRMVRNIKNKDNPRSFGYAIRTGLISAFAMRLYRQNKRKVFGDYNCFPLRTAIYICFPLRTANVVSLYSKRADNISARTGIDWNSSYIHPKHPRLTWTTIEDYYPTN